MQHSVKLEVTPEMIKRYNRPGPRYTSYPTVPVWKEGEFADDYATSLQKKVKTKSLSHSMFTFRFVSNFVLFADAINTSPITRT